MRRFLLAAGALLALASPALAGDARVFGTVGPWTIYQGKTFCTASSDHPNGTFLGFGIDADALAWVRVVNPSWKIPKGDYTVRLQFDSDWMVFQDGSMDLHAFTAGNSIDVYFRMEEGVFTTITKSAVLRVTAGSTDYRYSLRGTSAMMPRLLECIARAARESNPFAGQPASANPFQGSLR